LISSGLPRRTETIGLAIKINRVAADPARKFTRTMFTTPFEA
jgi:hypothetical protein